MPSEICGQWCSQWQYLYLWLLLLWQPYIGYHCCRHSGHVNGNENSALKIFWFSWRWVLCIHSCLAMFCSSVHWHWNSPCNEKNNMLKLWKMCGLSILKMAYQKDEDRLCTKACSNDTRSDGFKLNEGKFRLDIRRCFSWGGWWDVGTLCPEKLWMPHRWKCLKSCWMGLWATWSGLSATRSSQKHLFPWLRLENL